jgi:hypothetical protein
VVSATELELSRVAEGGGTAQVKEEVTFTPDIQIVPNGGTLPSGCVIWIPAQNTLKNFGFTNEPPGDLTLNAEIGQILTFFTSACTFPSSEANMESREGEIVAGEAKLAPQGKPATFLLGGKEPLGATAVPIEVATHEPHWYENMVRIAEQSGGPGQEGTHVLMWGTLPVTAPGIGTVTCLTEWLGNVYNPIGGKAGESRIHAYQTAYCANEPCEVTMQSKPSIEPEGLGVTVSGGVASAGAWEGKLSGEGSIRLKLGNKTAGSPTAIKWHVVCPKTTGEEYNKSLTGELTPQLENGSSIGAAPSRLQFNSGSGELEVGTEKAQVANNLKMMGFEGGELITAKAP